MINEVIMSSGASMVADELVKGLLDGSVEMKIDDCGAYAKGELLVSEDVKDNISLSARLFRSGNLHLMVHIRTNGTEHEQLVEKFREASRKELAERIKDAEQELAELRRKYDAENNESHEE